MSRKLIKIRFLGGLDDQQMRAFSEAAAAWNAILKDSVSFFPNVWTDIGIVKGIVIDASGARIDGRLGILGQAGPTMFQIINGKKFPRRGTMEFDIADLKMMTDDGSLGAVIKHEMGHVLGIGTLWDSFVTTGNDPRYSGPRALSMYKEVLNGKEASIPLEDTGGMGTKGSHWRESVFDTELMTGYAENGKDRMQLSVMTIAVLEDLGYKVDYSRAEEYRIPTGPVTLRSAEKKKKHCIRPPVKNITDMKEVFEKEFIKRVNKTFERAPAIKSRVKNLEVMGRPMTTGMERVPLV